jgi:hypothetical protein
MRDELWQARRRNIQHEVDGGDPTEFRLCFVCHALIPEGGGIWHAHLRSLVHQGACASLVRTNERDFTKSVRGRWRAPRNVFQLSNGARCARCADVR